jgi:hypothetical protein
MITRKRGLWIIHCIDSNLDLSTWKHLINDDDRLFLKAFKAENTRTSELVPRRLMDFSSKAWDLLEPFLEKNTIDDGFKLIFSDSPNYDKSVFDDCFVKIETKVVEKVKSKKLSLYAASLILGY